MELLLNWLTQGAFVGIAAAAGLRLIPRSHTEARYRFVWAAFLLILALPVVPFILAAGIDIPRVDPVPPHAGPIVTMPARWWTSPAVGIGLWIIWSSVHAVRIAFGAMAVRDAKRRAVECPRDLLAGLPHWSRVGTTGRPTRVVLSNHVRAAAVLGCGTPVVALTPKLVEQLSAADLDRVLVHEWAHVQRRDDVAQLAQQLVRVIVGWHPAAWWLERQLEFEREVACDEMVVRVTGSAKGYASCLATLAALPNARVASIPALAVSPASRLRGRVMRILTTPYTAAAGRWHVAAVCGVGGLVLCTLAAGRVSVVASAVTSSIVSTVAQPVGARPVVLEAAAAAGSVEQTGRASSAVPPGRPSARENVRVPQEKHTAARDDSTTSAIEEAAISPGASTPLPSSHWPLDASSVISVARGSSEATINTVDEAPASASPADAVPTPAEQARAAWTLAADTGVTIGRASRGAGIATAGFFSRLGKKIATSF